MLSYVASVSNKATHALQKSPSRLVYINDVLKYIKKHLPEEVVNSVLGHVSSRQCEFFAQHRSFAYHPGSRIVFLVANSQHETIANDANYVAMCREKLALLVSYLKRMGGTVSVTMANSFIEFDVQRLEPLLEEANCFALCSNDEDDLSTVGLLQPEPTTTVTDDDQEEREVTQLEFKTLYKTVITADANGDSDAAANAFRTFCEKHGPFTSWTLSHKDTEIVTPVCANLFPDPRVIQPFTLTRVLDVSGWTMTVAKPLNWLFSEFVDLEELVLPNEIHVHASARCPAEHLLEAMFFGCSSLKKCSPVNLVLHNAAPGDDLSLNNLFRDCRSLQRADVTLAIDASQEHKSKAHVYNNITCSNMFSECVNMKSCSLNIRSKERTRVLLLKDTCHMYFNCMSLEFAHVNLKDLEANPGFRARSMFAHCVNLSRGVACEFFKQLKCFPLRLQSDSCWLEPSIYHAFLGMFADVGKAKNGYRLDVWVDTTVVAKPIGTVVHVPTTVHDVDVKLRHMFGAFDVPKERGKYVAYVHVSDPNVSVYATIENRTRLATITKEEPLRLVFGCD